MNKYLIGLLVIPSFLIGMQLAPVQAQSQLQDATTQIGILDTVLRQNEHQDQVLDNHEDRITNSERDIEDLQTHTSTPQSGERVVVREVTTAKPEPKEEPEPAPQPVVVVSYRQILLENSEDVDCEYTYSDNTTYRWHWKTVEYNQGTKLTHASGFCDQHAIGTRDRPS